jgi:DNA ligase (NAD+)
MGPKSAENLISQIDNSKKRGLSRLIHGLGIRHVGEKMARSLADRFDSLEALAAASEEELTAIADVGPRVAESIRFFFTREENQALIKRLEEAGVVTLKRERGPEGARPLAGQIFVITGTLKDYTRDRAAEILEGLGAEVGTSVTRKTTGLIVGESPGSKLQKARELGLRILGETEFAELIGKK